MFIRQFVLSALVVWSVSAYQAPDNTDKNKRDREGTTMTAEKQGNSKGDLDLLAKIRREVNKDKGLSTNAHNVKIVVNAGRVWLRGPVATEAEKERIGSLAKHAARDGAVNNELEVSQGEK